MVAEVQRVNADTGMRHKIGDNCWVNIAEQGEMESSENVCWNGAFQKEKRRNDRYNGWWFN